MRTISDIASRLGLDRYIAYGLVRYLVAIGALHDRGRRPPSKAGGRGESVYDVDPRASQKISEHLRGLVD